MFYWKMTFLSIKINLFYLNEGEELGGGGRINAQLLILLSKKSHFLGFFLEDVWYIWTYQKLYYKEKQYRYSG